MNFSLRDRHLLGAGLAVWNQRRQRRREVCAPAEGPVDIQLTSNRPGSA